MAFEIGSCLAFVSQYSINLFFLSICQVVCHQLGQGSAVEILTGSVFGQASSDAPIWLTGVDCKGWELGLSQCVNSGWGNTGCSHYSDVGMLCYKLFVMFFKMNID